MKGAGAEYIYFSLKENRAERHIKKGNEGRAEYELVLDEQSRR